MRATQYALLQNERCWLTLCSETHNLPSDPEFPQGFVGESQNCHGPRVFTLCECDRAHGACRGQVCCGCKCISLPNRAAIVPPIFVLALQRCAANCRSGLISRRIFRGKLERTRRENPLALHPRLRGPNPTSPTPANGQRARLANGPAQVWPAPPRQYCRLRRHA